jgi:hypothetical protein
MADAVGPEYEDLPIDGYDRPLKLSGFHSRTVSTTQYLSNSTVLFVQGAREKAGDSRGSSQPSMRSHLVNARPLPRNKVIARPGRALKGLKDIEIEDFICTSTPLIFTKGMSYDIYLMNLGIDGLVLMTAATRRQLHLLFFRRDSR